MTLDIAVYQHHVLNNPTVNLDGGLELPHTLNFDSFRN
jgi:hypothetical protein